MRIVTTGGAGFLGSHLCEQLVQQGHRVHCIDNFITGRPENITHLLGHDRFSLLKYNVCDYLHIDGPLDAVLHFASPASPQDYLELPIATLKVGALGTHKALGLAKAKGARFLLASMSEVYGDPLISPQEEGYWGNVNPISPRGVYDEAKRFAEAMTMAYHRYHGLDTRIIRIFNTYGPFMRPNDGRVVSNFIVQALTGKPITIYGEGLQTRSFCYVDDLLEGFVRFMRTPDDVIGPINLGNPEEFTIMRLAELVIEITGSRSKLVRMPLPADDPRQRMPDITLARKTLSWEPSVRLETGLRRTCEYFERLLHQQPRRPQDRELHVPVLPSAVSQGV